MIIVILLLSSLSLSLQIYPDSMVVYTTGWRRRPKGFPVLPRWDFAFALPIVRIIINVCIQHLGHGHHLHLKHRDKKIGKSKFSVDHIFMQISKLQAPCKETIGYQEKLERKLILRNAKIDMILSSAFLCAM